MYKKTGTNWTKIKQKFGPSARYGAFMEVVGKYLIYGFGMDAGPNGFQNCVAHYFNDLWAFDSDTEQWTELIQDGAAGSPPARGFVGNVPPCGSDQNIRCLGGGYSGNGCAINGETLGTLFSGSWRLHLQGLAA